jgi:fluoride exporter
MAYLWVCLGSAIGGGCRYWVTGLIARRFGEAFPTGTIAVNVTGCFLVGLLAALNVPDSRFLISPGTRQLLMVGVLGGYTTFSTFSLQTINLVQDGDWLHAGAYVLLSVVLCLAAVWLGQSAGAFLNVSR